MVRNLLTKWKYLRGAVWIVLRFALDIGNYVVASGILVKI